MKAMLSRVGLNELLGVGRRCCTNSRGRGAFDILDA